MEGAGGCVRRRGSHRRHPVLAVTPRELAERLARELGRYGYDFSDSPGSLDTAADFIERAVLAHGTAEYARGVAESAAILQRLHDAETLPANATEVESAFYASARQMLRFAMHDVRALAPQNGTP